MNSTEYKRERERARKDRTEEDKKDEEAAKLTVYRLKHQRHRAKMLERTLQQDPTTEMCASDEVVYRRYRDGSLQRDLDEAKRIHGYGTLSTGEHIGAKRPKYTTDVPQ